MEKTSIKRQSPWSWIPTLYFAEGLPYFMVMSVAVLMYSRLGLSDEDVAKYTSWLYLPWVIKPFWSPVVELFRSKRWWIVTMQILIGAGMAGVAFTIPTSGFLQWTMCFFWLMAFSSATHDIAADGFYMEQLDENNQSIFVGIRSTFYRVATIFGQGGLITIAGILEIKFKAPPKAWSYIFIGTSILFFILFLYHFLFLPKKGKRTSKTYTNNELLKDFCHSFGSFFKKKNIIFALIFMLTFRISEAFLVKISQLFLTKPLNEGGLQLSVADIGIVWGTVGVMGLMLGGVIGGIKVSEGGLKKWLWPMVCAITLPNIVYVILAYYQPEYSEISGKIIINASVFIEQFGYGFGFTAYMMYLIYFSQGNNQTSHYAFCTGFMALGMMIPGWFAGMISDSIGYLNFFILVMCLVPITFIVSSFLKIDSEFGRKKEDYSQTKEEEEEEEKKSKTKTLIYSFIIILFMSAANLSIAQLKDLPSKKTGVEAKETKTKTKTHATQSTNLVTEEKTNLDNKTGISNIINNKDNEELSKDVIIGNYGCGKERKELLGNRYDDVQSLVNKYYQQKKYDNINKNK